MGSKTKTTTPINPQWSTDVNQGLAGGVLTASKVDPLTRIAPTNSLLDAATASAGAGISPEIMKLLGQGSGSASVSAQSGSDFMKNYQNPYLDQVLKATLADYDVNAGQQTAQADLGLAGSGAFGGSGAALTKSMLGGELARGRASAESGIRSDAFTTAANYGSQDANRFLDASKANASFADSAAGRALTAAGLLGNLNQQQFSNQFSMGDYLRGIDNQTRNADISQLAQLASINGSIPYNLFNGNKTKESGGALGSIGSGLLGLGSILAMPATGGLSGTLGGAMFGLSDIRLKRDIERIATRPDGLGVYLFRYLWSPILHIGVMAQEVLKVRPEAVIMTPLGYLAVDYGQLEGA